MAAALMTFVVMSACGHGDGVLVVGGADSQERFGMGSSMTAAEPYMTVQVTTVCIKSQAPVEIKDVRSDVSGEAFGVSNFSVNAAPIGEADNPILKKRLSQIFKVSHEVATSCNDRKSEAYLYVEVPRPASAVGKLDGLTIETSQGKTLKLNAEIMACRKECPSDTARRVVP